VDRRKTESEAAPDIQEIMCILAEAP